jgi:hypothetical protein
MRQRSVAATKWDIMSMGRLVRKLRATLGLPETFTLDACRHGSMIEMEEAAGVKIDVVIIARISANWGHSDYDR